MTETRPVNVRLSGTKPASSVTSGREFFFGREPAVLASFVIMLRRDVVR